MVGSGYYGGIRVSWSDPCPVFENISHSVKAPNSESKFSFLDYEGEVDDRKRGRKEERVRENENSYVVYVCDDLAVGGVVERLPVDLQDLVRNLKLGLVRRRTLKAFMDV